MKTADSFWSFLCGCLLLAISVTALPTGSFGTTWTAKGPGQTSITTNGNKVFFHYNLDVTRTWGIYEWTLQGLQVQTNAKYFDWDYDGTHDGHQAATILRFGSKELVGARSGTGTFLYEGRDEPLLIGSKGVVDFRLLATSDDLNKFVSGTLEIAMVPLPGALWLSLPFFGVLGSLGIRKSARRQRRGPNPPAQSLSDLALLTVR